MRLHGLSFPPTFIKSQNTVFLSTLDASMVNFRPDRTLTKPLGQEILCDILYLKS